jgi:hypothetical protein
MTFLKYSNGFVVGDNTNNGVINFFYIFIFNVF